MQRRRAAAAALLASALTAHNTAALTGAVRAPFKAHQDISTVDVEEPGRYWRQAGFVLMTPAIRPSVAAYSGARTQIYLYLPPNDRVAAKRLDDGRITLHYPPGTEADRISWVPVRSTNGFEYTIEDVRGTRWGADGREFFHVYRPRTGTVGSALTGFEWPRDNRDAVRATTRYLGRLVARTPAPGSRYPPAPQTVRRVEMLNHCARCHISNKATAKFQFERLPPWATDAHGLYTPLHVMQDSAPLSAIADFHDPNVGDPWVRALCPNGDGAKVLGRRGARYYQCRGAAAPVGYRDVAGGMRANDRYSVAVCRARRYLYERMSPHAQTLFAANMQACFAKT
ncbi:MAG: hypothetical protein GKR94_30450 [Gammaproteobacteria bacterium]|nr:hypothetical protein [Gammaproteobacteria bacterium]